MREDLNKKDNKNLALGISLGISIGCGAGVAIGAATAAWNSYKARAEEAAQMAQGGIVPPGYPHDTYPAMLSSGEAVFTSSQMRNLSNLLYGGRVIFEIEGTKLVGVLENQNRKVGSFK